jgi:hypothetical protein
MFGVRLVRGHVIDTRKKSESKRHRASIDTDM